MTKEELKKEAQEQVNYCTPLYPESFIQGYLAGAEPRENQIADIKANCDLAIEGRDIKIKELEKNLKLWTDTKDARETIFFQQKRKIAELEKENAELKKEVEKHKWNNILLEDCAGYDKKIAEEYTNLQERIEELEKENRKLNKLYTLAKDVVKQFLNDCVITNDVLDKIEPLIKEMKIEY